MFDFSQKIVIFTKFSNINERGLTILESHILSMLVYQLYLLYQVYLPIIEKLMKKNLAINQRLFTRHCVISYVFKTKDMRQKLAKRLG